MPTGSEIMKRAGVLLNDTEYTRWTPEDLCEWINEACRAIVLAKPSACSTTITLALQKGTHQTIPTDGSTLALVKVVRNLRDNNDRSKSGRTITVTDGAVLDAQIPNWHDDRYVRFRREVRHYVYDEATPLEFYVYPGNDGEGVVEAAISKLPTKLVASSDPSDVESYAADIGLPEPYSVPILDYVLSRAHMVDDIDGNPGRSLAHYQQFATAIGLKIQVEGATSPNSRRRG